MHTKVSMAVLATIFYGAAAKAPVGPSKPKSAPAAATALSSPTLVAGACSSGYADTQLALKLEVRDFENSGRATYTRLIRTDATYETLYYGPDGAVQRRRHKATAFGTGVAYLRRNEDVYFLTNHHVAVLPSVTSDQQKVEGVPAGAKKILEESRLVESDSDENFARQIKLTKVALDPEGDAAIMKGRPTVDQPIPVMPYKVGRSSELRAGNFVWVRGFPLGVFQAVNVGRVTNPLDEDNEQGWSHRDFIIDALLSSGNSGSPVFAIDCKTQTLELVGLYHAAYRAASALNAVIAIDELREMMETFRAPKRGPRASEMQLTERQRNELQPVLSSERPSRVFPFGGLVASVSEANNRGYRFSVFDKDYPSSLEPRIWIVDRPEGEGDFGDIVTVGFVDRSSAPHELPVERLDAGLRRALLSLYHSLVRQWALVESTRTRSSSQPTDVSREVSRLKAVQRDHLDNALDALAEEWAERQQEF